jgi:hypothetical protein
MVDEDQAAHHCGYSRIVAGGALYSRTTLPSPNQVSLGMEIENRNDGRDPYPDIQILSVGWQLVQWVRRYNVALVKHADIDTQGKSDPKGLSWERINAAMGAWLGSPPPPAIGYTPESLLLTTSGLSPEQLGRALITRCPRSHYTPAELTDLAQTYTDLERASGINAWLAAAQMCHETGNLTSARSAPPQRNLAGIGATNDGAQGVSFSDLTTAARAQVGRLLAYATTPALRFGPQQALVDAALKWRPLPLKCQGSAPALYQLGANPNVVDGCGWASPGDKYGQAIAAVANALVRSVM